MILGMSGFLAHVAAAGSTLSGFSLQPSDPPRTSPAASVSGTIPQALQRAVLLAAADLTPSAIAALDISPQSLEAFLNGVDPESTAATAVMERMMAVSTANKARAEKLALAHRDPTPQNVAAYRQAAQTASEAQGQLASGRRALAVALHAGLSAGQQTQLKRFRAAERAGMPIEFGSALTTPAEFAQATEDLGAEAEAAHTGQTPDESVQSRLTALRTAAPVIATSQRLSQRRAATESAVVTSPSTNNPNNAP